MKSNIVNNSMKEFTKYLRIYHTELYLHLFIVFIFCIIFLILSPAISIIYNWISSILYVIGTLGMVSISIYLYVIITAFDDIMKTYTNKLWTILSQLGLINHRLLKEYKLVYHLHCSKIKNDLQKHQLNIKCDDCDVCHKRHDHDVISDDKLEKLKEYVLEVDTHNQMENEDVLKRKINNIYTYIKLSYYLSSLKESDILEIRGNNIFVNSMENLFDKRNRNLEKIMNNIPNEYKTELVESWSMIDQKKSKDIIILVPYKWILNEYRSLYRYLHLSKYFKNIYDNFDKDYNHVENKILNVSECILNMFKYDMIYLPEEFIYYLEFMMDLITIILDIFLSINIISFILTNGIFVSLFSMISGFAFGIIFHGVVIVMMHQLKNLINTIQQKKNNSEFISNIDDKMNTMMNEIKVLTQ